MAGEKDKKLILGVLPYLLALITAFQHQFAIIYNLIFQTQQQRAMILHLSHTATISRFQIARRKIKLGLLTQFTWSQDHPSARIIPPLR